MKITLYKNAIFTNSYSEVCENWNKDSNGKTCLTRYLESLSKLEFNLDTVYMTNSGYINIPFSLSNGGNAYSAYDFNYMKVEQGDFIRYCFVDNIELKNQVAVIYYSEDYWHSYFNPSLFRYGNLVNSYKINYANSGVTDSCEVIVMPTEKIVESMDTIQLTPVGMRTDSSLDTYFILAQMQIYKTTKSGEASNRFVNTVLLKSFSSLEVTSLDYALETVRRLIITKSSGKVTYYSETDYNYDIDNFTFIKTGYDVNGILAREYSETEADYTIKIEGDYELYAKPIFSTGFGTISSTFELCHFNLGWDKYSIGVGTLNDNIQTLESGGVIPISLIMHVDAIDCKIYMKYRDKLVDITESFVVDYPINAITGEINAQRKMARIMGNISSAIKIGEGVGQVAKNISVTGGMTTLNYAGSGVGAILSQGNNIVPYSKGFANFQSIYGNSGGISYDVYDVNKTKKQISYNGDGTGLGKIAGGIMGLVANNAPLYTSNAMVSSNGINTELINKGIVKFYATSLVNEVMYNEMPSYTGYKVNDIVSNVVFYPIENDSEYDIIAFNFVNLYGPTQLVTTRLKEILLAGTRIWYNNDTI